MDTTTETKYIPIWSLRIVREGEHPLPHVRVKNPAQAVEILRSFVEDRDREFFVVMPLTTKNTPICLHVVTIGTIHTTIVQVREIFKVAIHASATGVILAHNHPSGDPDPSPEDVALTKEIVKAGELLDIPVLDHLIIGSDGKFVSLKERNLGF